MSQYNSPKFNKLRTKWYAKLKKSGFDDIEKTSGDLKLSATQPFVRQDSIGNVRRNPVLRELIQAYYSGCRSFLIEHEFKNKLEQTIWEMHSEGISGRSIAKKIKVSHTKVDSVIARLKKEMLDGKRVSNDPPRSKIR